MNEEEKKIDVLNHGYVRLVDHMGDDLSVVRAARVSYNADWRTGDDAGKDEKLINYLMRNGHTSPFEHVEFSFEVKAPIFVFRQWHRHRTWSFNEISARYSKLPQEFYVPEVNEIGIQSEDNKQSRTFEAERIANAEEIRHLMITQNNQSYQLYLDLLNKKVPREIARSVLPVAMYSKMFAKVDLHNLLKFIGKRLHTDAQYEIRVYAEAMLKLISDIVPVSIKAWKKYNDIRI